VDESLVTGEPIPVEKMAGDRLIAGTRNGNGPVVMQADRVGADTTLSRIVRLVAEASRSRAPIQRLVDQVSAVFVPLVAGAAIAAFAGWALFGPAPRLSHALVSAISVLIIACPCALGLATPMAILVAAGRGAKAGILIRNADALQRFERVDTLILDKTGTLTEGRPRIAEIHTVPPYTEESLLAAAASLAQMSEHPLSRVIAREALRRGIVLVEPTEVANTPGAGVQGSLAAGTVRLGSESFVAESGADLVALLEIARSRRARGAPVVFVSVNGKAAGLLVAEDPVRRGAQDAVAALLKEGIRIVMATGDAAETAQFVAAAVGIREVKSRCSPADKAALVGTLRAEGRVVAMAGDGVNDAPALAAADVGIAMGSGTYAANENAGITLGSPDLSALVRARGLSMRTMANVRQNLFFAFAYNAVLIPVAAGALFPWTGLFLSPMLAAAAMSFSSLTVIGNALRLR